MYFKDLPNNEKPRERLKIYGKENLSNEELLQILIQKGNRKYSVKDISLNVLGDIKDISNLKNYSLNTLSNIEGMSEVKATLILSAVELGKRIYKESSPDTMFHCTTPDAIINYFHNLFIDTKQEEFYVLYLDNKKKFIDKRLLFKGSINISIVHPREIFKEAYLLSSSFIICIHNHPSGDPSPSREDIEVTKKLVEIGKIHGIPLIDHLIIGNNKYYSFYEDNRL